MVYILQHKKWILWIFSLLFVVPTSALADYPLAIDTYIFSMPEPVIKSMLKDGLTRTELTTLQTQYFETGCLLPKQEPLVLDPGENRMDISHEQILDLQEEEATAIIVFLFEISRKDIENKESAQIERYTYAITFDAQEQEIKLGEKEGEWTFPEGIMDYRFMDYRSAYLLRYEKFVYNLTITMDDEIEEFKLVFDFTEENY